MNVPKFTIDGNENRIITFEFKGVAKDANRLRIIFMNKIPVMAIDKITIIQNSCLLDDQLLCNRVALIPITNNDSEGIIPSEMIIDEKCEGDELIVLSSDIRDGDPTYKNIPIATLIKGQSLNIRMTTKKGTGKDHNKYSPISTAVYDQQSENVFLFTVESLGVFLPEKLMELAFSIYNSS